MQVQTIFSTPQVLIHFRERDKERERQRYQETERQRDRDTERQRDRDTEKQRHRETERDRQKCRQLRVGQIRLGQFRFMCLSYQKSWETPDTSCNPQGSVSQPFPLCGTLWALKKCCGTPYTIKFCLRNTYAVKVDLKLKTATT